MEANYFTISYWFCHTSTWILLLLLFLFSFVGFFFNHTFNFLNLSLLLLWFSLLFLGGGGWFFLFCGDFFYLNIDIHLLYTSVLTLLFCCSFFLSFFHLFCFLCFIPQLALCFGFIFCFVFLLVLFLIGWFHFGFPLIVWLLSSTLPSWFCFGFLCVCVCVCVCACVCTHTHAYTCLYFLCSSVFLDFALTFVWVSFLSLLLPWWMACGVLIPWLEVWPEPLGSKHWVQDTEQRIPGPRDYWSVRAPIKASVQIQDLVPPNCL